MKAAPVLSPVVKADAAWSAAADRIARYLRAHRLGNARQVSRLTADIIAIARTRVRPGAEPMALAMETLDAGMVAWFAQVLPAGEAGHAPLLTRGRVALVMGEVPARWPGHFMSGQTVPAELSGFMREADPGRAPEIKFTNMAPRLIAEAAPPGSRLRWQWSYRWPFLRIVSGLMMVVSLWGAAMSAGGR